MRQILPFVLLLITLSAFSQEGETKKNNAIKLRDVQKEGPLINSTPPVDEFTAGDCLKRAGTHYLGSIFFAGVGTFFYTEGIKENDQAVKAGGIVCMAGGVLLYFSGHIQLIKAGKAYNKEQITLSAASEGIGLAINF